MSGPYLFLTPDGLTGRTILVNFSYVLRAEPNPEGTGTLLTLLQDSDPDGLRTLRVEEPLTGIASQLAGDGGVSGGSATEPASNVYGVTFTATKPDQRDPAKPADSESTRHW